MHLMHSCPCGSNDVESSMKIKRNDCVFLIHDLQFLPTSCRIQDYNATGQYQSGSGRVAACSNDYSTTNESLYNTMYSSLDLSASAAAMSDMLMARQYSGGGGHAPSSTPPLSYNSAAINEHLLQGKYTIMFRSLDRNGPAINRLNHF